MSDVLTPEQRRHCMSRNRGTRTGPEELLRKALWASGLRYRIHHGLPGRPDVVLPAKRLVVFVDGCFWHGCPIHYQAPHNNADFWAAKIENNRNRDAEVTKQLECAGWRVVRFWEHDVKSSLSACVDMIRDVLINQETQSPVERCVCQPRTECS